MLKKISLIVSLALLLTVILAGCSNDAPPAPPNAPVGIAKESPPKPESVVEDDVINIDLQTLISAAKDYNKGQPEKFEALVGKTLRFEGKVVMTNGTIVASLYLQPNGFSALSGAVNIYVPLSSSEKNLNKEAMSIAEGDVITVEGVLKPKEGRGMVWGADYSNTICSLILTKLN